ncbi:phosphoribosylanthranilate isomerase [Bacillus massiliigorillae]|uniref:phosphoribosylanthranilate isomerase n=1 Tax=Bacillus massiliigorillae TaxID=1243664 RepID=UPI00039F8771|nr:phosphoribosylanthranilate isomerase [Bacillus massiliigorillae]
MKVKICGLTDVETAVYAAEVGADAIGFVFAPSRRQISKENAKKIIEELPARVEKVGVFVNEKPAVIEEIAAACGLTMIQLHGEESNGSCQVHALPVVKAVGIGKVEDIVQAEQYEVPYLLVDSPKGQKYYGGNGATFDWQLLQSKALENHRVILAGGLTADNVAKAIATVQPYMVDVSSGVETDGKKDFVKIKQFIQVVKGVEIR